MNTKFYKMTVLAAASAVMIGLCGCGASGQKAAQETASKAASTAASVKEAASEAASAAPEAEAVSKAASAVSAAESVAAASSAASAVESVAAASSAASAAESVTEAASTVSAAESTADAASTVSAAESAADAASTASAAESAADTASTASTASAADASAPTQGEDLGDDEVAGWHIVTELYEVNPSLENISVALGYGNIQTSEFVKTAQEGQTFCMVKLLIEKKGSKEVIDWDNMILTDSEGNEYHRIDDEFILDLGMKRMPGTKLNFGSNEGWICYEVPQDATGLTLSYAFDDGTYSCDLTEA